MDLLLHALTSSALFASRAFLPALATAVLLRFGRDIPWVSSSDFVQGLPQAPSWFTSNACLGVLALLSAVEWAANRSADARALLAEVDTWLKPCLAVLTYVGLASTTDTEFVTGTLDKGSLLGPTPFALALGALDGGVAAVTFVLVKWLAGLRGAVTEMLSDADEDDDAGVQGLVAWAEDLWAVGGTLFIVLYPLLMALALAGTWGAIWLWRRRAEKREEAQKAPCPKCQAPVWAAAPACGQCRTPQAQPRDIGWLGTAVARPAPDAPRHPFVLASRKRCPQCAARLKAREPHQQCPECSADPFGDPAFLQQYLGFVSARLPGTLAACAVLSLIPILGLVPGVIWYRLQLVGPFRRYVPRVRSFFVRWMLRLLFLVLSLFQLVPGVGALAVPLMAYVNYLAWRSVFTGLAAERKVAVAAG
jgi:hypothetical protein